MPKKWYESGWFWAAAGGGLLIFLVSRKGSAKPMPPSVKRFVDAYLAVYPDRKVVEWMVGGTSGAEDWMGPGDVVVNFKTSGFADRIDSRGTGSQQQGITAADLNSMTHDQLVAYVKEGTTI